MSVAILFKIIARRGAGRGTVAAELVAHSHQGSSDKWIDAARGGEAVSIRGLLGANVWGHRTEAETAATCKSLRS